MKQTDIDQEALAILTAEAPEEKRRLVRLTNPTKLELRATLQVTHGSRIERRSGPIITPHRVLHIVFAPGESKDLPVLVAGYLRRERGGVVAGLIPQLELAEIPKGAA